ncbi:cell wall-binding protein [Clostridium botulinum]|uniref:cell wall-binding protein n=1 Tax=Clostridium botulinum TaxID=1491 RepID=UPI000174E6BB|nr:cell wall-binding protein [Clostridium botulinum]ACD53377.1 cell wall binding repeat domain protein [Clostridium botulinum E3 str. Alaska E43]MBY6816499.1 cell wall-binding protein [Clostridium botulinum]MBY6827246.1 cell wall-binding protein [Clostridium botulinum]MBY6859194.1 cell wall-binding protein [Clostridium botulinum]MBY7041522.1 cell wall-binding protein [Clostridium botulinum]
MKKKFLKATMAIMIASVTVLTPITANAAWKQNSTGWWYTQGNSYTMGWCQIDNQWYYFDNNGYMKTGWINDNGNWYYCWSNGQMAHDCYIGNYYLNSKGVWTTNTGSSSNIESVTDSQIAYLSATGDKYHKIPNCGKMNPNKAIKTTVSDAKVKHKICEKCW